jgi:DNA mismatch repair protein MutL
MGKIALLSKMLQNQIAAGEVIERPASVVKELLENAIDAGAQNITLEIEKGGIQKIRIIDDGEGMDEEDVRLSFQRYATSKIRSVDDLFSIHSFGFRGEAIASIASVSSFTIRTRQKNDEVGRECVGGEEITPCACPVGTEILVENIFWNVPARKKFLKSETTESREIIKLVESFALANESIGFTVKKDGKEVFSFLPQTQKERCEAVMGKNISEFFLPLSFLGHELKISGFCTHPHFHRSSRDRQFLFVNKRIVNVDRSMQGAISQAYATLLPKGKFPAFVLFVDIAPEKVDVNVHPRKSEVRFQSPSEIFQIVKGTFLSALSKKGSDISPNTSPAQNAFYTAQSNFSPENISSAVQRQSASFAHSSPTSSTGFFPAPSSTNTSVSPVFTPVQSSQETFFSGENERNGEEDKKYRIIGQIRKSFVVVEEQDGVKIIDQHAAHERIRYEQLLRDFRAKTVVSQPLLAPVIFSISQSEKLLLLEEQESIADLGFEIEDFGGQDIAVLSVPSSKTPIDVEKLFRNLLDDFDTFDPSFGANISEFAEKMLSYTACRGAIKFGDELSMSEMEQLVEDWNKCTHSQACAHGRPVSTAFSYTSLENECGRY